MGRGNGLRTFYGAGVLMRSVSLSVIVVGVSFFAVNGEGIRDAAAKVNMY